MTARNFRFVLIGLISAVLLGGVAAGYYGINMLHKEVERVNKVGIDAEINTEARVSAEQAKKKLDDPQIAKLSEHLEKVIPNESYQNQFIADVNKYAAESGVPLASLAYSDDGDAPSITGTTAIPIVLNLGSDIPYSNFISFVKKLENNLQHVQVLSIDMQPKDENGSILSSASLSVALYVEAN